MPILFQTKRTKFDSWAAARGIRLAVSRVRSIHSDGEMLSPYALMILKVSMGSAVEMNVGKKIENED
ncbi:hypothetical protein SRHO_G00293230 [Serrasalmus rhombeus]